MAIIKWLQGVFESRKNRAADKGIYGTIDEQLVFAKSEALTLGVECELAVLDRHTLQPVSKGLELIAEMDSPCVKKELFEHMVEITSTIGRTVHDTEAQMTGHFRALIGAAERRGLLITGTGCPPTLRRALLRRVPDDRYQRLQDERKILNERFGTLGMHIHIGMSDAEQCVRFHNFFMHFIPHLIALSSSSPFEEGLDTGLMSIRPTIAESLPVAGVPYNFQNWQEYVSLCHAMYRAGSIRSLKDLWWDVRSSPRYGTLELRICDQPPTLAEVLAITAFVHGLAHWFQENQSWLSEMPRPSVWMQRDNKWRAMRYGLKADLVVNAQGETRPIALDIRQWLERLHPYIDRYDYHGYIDVLNKMMERGNSAARQRQIWEQTQDLKAVARFNCDEFTALSPLWEQAKPAMADLIPDQKQPSLAKAV